MRMADGRALKKVMRMADGRALRSSPTSPSLPLVLSDSHPRRTARPNTPLYLFLLILLPLLISLLHLDVQALAAPAGHEVRDDDGRRPDVGGEVVLGRDLLCCVLCVCVLKEEAGQRQRAAKEGEGGRVGARAARTKEEAKKRKEGRFDEGDGGVVRMWPRSRSRKHKKRTKFSSGSSLPRAAMGCARSRCDRLDGGAVALSGARPQGGRRAWSASACVRGVIGMERGVKPPRRRQAAAGPAGDGVSEAADALMPVAPRVSGVSVSEDAGSPLPPRRRCG
jgi:hypothetical protein